jgi:MFS family permease
VDGFAVVDPPGLPSEVTKSLDGMLSFGGHNSFVGAGEKEDVIHRLRKIAARHDSPSGQQIEDCLRASSFRKGDFPVMALPRDEIPLGLDVAIEFDGHLKTLGCFHGDIPGQLTRPPDVPGDRIIVAATDAGWVDAIAGNLATMAGLGTSTGVTVERSQSLLDARAAVADEVARRDRESVLVILAAATALACVVVFTGTIAGRRDFGRRRALGASQRQLTILVMLTTLWPSLIGAVIGTALGSVYLGSLLGHAPDWRFPVSVGVLTVIALVCSSAPPAAVAATRDPLRVLRVP